MRCCIAVMLLGLSLSGVALGQVTTTAGPSADAFVTSANPTGNFGGAGAVGVAAPGLSKGEFRSFLRFDTSAIKSSFDSAFGTGNWTIQSATLRLAATSPNNSIFNGFGAGPGGTNVNAAGNFSASWISDDDWVEGTGNPASPGVTGVTFNAPADETGAQVLGTFNFTGGTSGTQTYNLTLTAGLLADLNAGGLLSTQLVTAAGDTAIAYLCSSRTGSNPPVLSVTAIPEPTALATAGLMMGTLIRRKRR